MTIMLDAKDKKILYELDVDSRQSFSQIARKIGLSKNAVIYRVEQLKKQGLIRNFTTVIDSGKLGYISFRMYINLQNTTLKKEEEIINYLKNNRIITWVASAEGKYNLVAVGVTKNLQEINNLWDGMMHKYLNYFGERLITAHIRSTHFSRAYLIKGVKNTYEILTAKYDKDISIDETDKSILRILSGNARAPILEISEKLKMTPKTIISRIKKLEHKGIIIAYRTFFDKDKIGSRYFKVSFTLVKITPKRAKELYSYIKQHPNIVCREETLGGDDFEIDLEVESINELRKIIQEMRTKFGDIIHDYQILHVFQEYKSIFLTPLSRD